MRFTAASVVVALGKAGDPPHVDDGDEVLIFRPEEFFRLAKASFRKYQLIKS